MLHSLIFLYMLISLNVAINSYDYTLLSLLISNQFVEIKGCMSLLEHADESRFQEVRQGESLSDPLCRYVPLGLADIDIVERFQLGLMLTIISLRNILEMSGSDVTLLPKSFGRGKSLVDSILSVSLE